MACVPIVKILIMCGIGTFLALPSVNVFPLDARKHLNKLVYLVFTPALVFTRLAEAVTLHQLIAWWYMPINVLFCFTLGALLGSLVVKYCKPPKHLNHLTIACCSAGNTGNLLMVLIPGICIEKDSPFGDSNVCSENGLAYVSFGMWFAALVIGACAPLKALCFGPQAPLRFLTDCAKILGDAMIPCMILILGGNLAMGAGDSDMQMPTIIGIVMTRFVALPIVGIVIINIIQKMGVLPIDPLFKLVLILQFCMPTAISLGTIAQLHNYCEKEMAVVLFWLYITSAFFISIWATIALYLL
ncbi:hypothetical protein BDL97_05G009500 [Sphagnum fallax]|nr:hypothetical protein BDL97_05G009500 [Sphagnum fallax]